MARPAKYDDGEILDRAMTVSWERGWEQTSIRDLERALDLKAPSIYRRFGSRDGLGEAVVDHYVRRIVERRIEKYLPPSGDPRDNLRRFLEQSVTEPEHGGALRGCLLTSMSNETARPAPEIERALSRGRARIADALADETRRAAELGLLREGVDSEEAADSLTLAMQGLMSMARAGEPSSTLRRRARSAVAVVSVSVSVD